MRIVSEIVWKETIDVVPIDDKAILFYVPYCNDEIKTGHYRKGIFYCAASAYPADLVPLWADMACTEPRKVKDV